MEPIYRLINNFMLGSFISFSYQAILSVKRPKPLPLLIASAVFTVYMFVAHTSIIEPFRTLIGIFVLGASLWVWKRVVNWAALVLAFLWGYFVRIIAMLLSAVFVIVVGVAEESVVIWLWGLVAQAGVYFALFHIPQFKRGFPAIVDIEVKGIIFSAAGIVLVFFGGFHLTTHQMYELNLPLFHASMAALGFAFLILALLIVYLSRRHRERMATEQRQRELEAGHRDLARRHHKYREVVSAIGSSFALEGEANKQLVRQMAAELSTEFATDDLEDTLHSFRLPTAWRLLQVRIAQGITQCRKIGITVFVKSCTASTWETVPLSQMKFIRLFGNLLSNAIKQLEQTDIEGKILHIRFFDADGCFGFALEDNAHAFPIEVLAKLGQRGNSTNGTGDGYAEVFELLAESSASLLITEWHSGGIDLKEVRVVFDGQARVVIRAGARLAALKTALTDTAFTVEYDKGAF